MGFFREFMLHPGQVGAVAPSSSVLADVIVREAALPRANVVVEFGPGTGVMTERILAELSETATFFAMEINPAFVEATRRRCPGARVVNDSAVNVGKYLDQAAQSGCDCIVSGLPWAAFDDELQDTLLSSIVGALRPGGRFVTYAYLLGTLLPAGTRFRQKLRASFRSVRMTHPVWRNLPAAFVYVAEK